jgi:AcrR family transcriptional regulator
MPKASSITKEIIVDAAFEIVRADGFGALSTRNIAKKIGCSTQPIYWAYENMEVLKQDVISKMLQFLGNQIGSYKKTSKPFLDLGLGYVRTAFTEPVLFKSLYVNNVLKIKLTDLIPSEMMTEAMQKETEALDISEEKLNDIAVKSWIFAHGLASLIATGMIEYNEEKVETMLYSFFLDINGI